MAQAMFPPTSRLSAYVCSLILPSGTYIPCHFNALCEEDVENHLLWARPDCAVTMARRAGPYNPFWHDLPSYPIYIPYDLSDPATFKVWRSRSLRKVSRLPCQSSQWMECSPSVGACLSATGPICRPNLRQRESPLRLHEAKERDYSWWHD